ncbi:Ldh family oxidoreductase [Noviherbaspirillum suwonense]|uniref:L-lactate dehydrogenase n=1 Tax=Noviherbaspirillum suwonense TaxID=1224511 RepID=A0ABY1QDX7_9BURK|nr:Ldh family oxidoreductase [Noviherbaspirillum suwonense]SMP66805.1 L-lactate dehydrogenase [Noviherbaspirillum suwonense]
MNETVPARYDYPALRDFAASLFGAAGLDAEKAENIAEILVEADLMGHSTHGLALAPWYLDAIKSGAMTLDGEPEILSDRGACVLWNGRRLPGTWLTAKAVDLAVERVATYGTVTVSISESWHIGALAAYLPRATDKGYMVMLACSTPTTSGVAPYGGSRPLFTPNPYAAGIPTDADPILLDISASITTLNKAKQLFRAGESFTQPWVMDVEGNPTTDPAAVVNGGGSLLPVGGLDHGHKGYSMALLVEALTQGLGGFGRSDHPSGTSVSVFLQVIDPTAFGGREQFTKQTTWLADSCRSNPPRPGTDRVRVPGDRALATKREALRRGVPLEAAITNSLRPYIDQFGLSLPEPVTSQDR